MQPCQHSAWQWVWLAGFFVVMVPAPAPGGTTLLNPMDNHWNISRSQVTALVTWSKSSMLIWFSLGADTYPQRNSWNLQILASSTCEETLFFFSNLLGAERQCCKGFFPHSWTGSGRLLDSNRLSLGGKSCNFLAWRFKGTVMYRKYHRQWKTTPALSNIDISYIELLIQVYTVRSV